MVSLGFKVGTSAFSPTYPQFLWIDGMIDLALPGQLAERFGKGRRVLGRLEVGPYQHSVRLHAVLKIIRCTSCWRSSHSRISAIFEAMDCRASTRSCTV